MTDGTGEGSGTFDAVAAARGNEDFRRVLTTGPHLQVVVMTIPPGGSIGAETHPDTDQVLWFVDGRATVVLDGREAAVGPGDVTFVRAGTHHDVRTDGDDPLRVVTAYAPPEHPPGTIHRTRAEADAAEHDR